MVRQYEVRTVADSQPSVHFDAKGSKSLYLLDQRLRINDDAVAKHADGRIMKDSRRDESKDEFSIANYDRVAGIVTALVPRHDVEGRRKQINDLSLAFVAPLGTHYHDVLHRRPLTKNGRPVVRADRP